MLVPKTFNHWGGVQPFTQPQLLRPVQQLPTPNPWSALLAAGLIIGGIWAAAELFAPQPAPRRRRKYQAEPLLIADKEYVSVRDGWRCTYCGRRVTRRTRHIDHSVSRANGGTNHLNNLRLSCAPCNLGKGPINSREFIRTFR